MLRFILYFLLFLIIFRLFRKVLTYFFVSKRNIKTNSQPNKKKSKFDDAEEAKYIEIKPEDEKKN